MERGIDTELEFYSLIEQIDEDHYEETYYHIGKPCKAFHVIEEEAKEHFLLRSSNGENVSQWDVFRALLIQNGYHKAQTKKTAYIGGYMSEHVLSGLKPTPKSHLDGFMFEESKTFREVNAIRVKYGQNPLTSEDVGLLLKENVEEEIEEEVEEESQETEEQNMADDNEKIETLLKPLNVDDFNMDEFDAFLPKNKK